MNFEGQWRVLEMKLSGGRHDLDLADDVDDGVTAQYLSCHCERKRGQNIMYAVHTQRMRAGVDNIFRSHHQELSM